MAAPTWDLTNLELRVRERTDMVNSTFVSSAEVQRFLQGAWQEYYGELINAHPTAMMDFLDFAVAAGVSSPTLTGVRGRVWHGLQLLDASGQEQEFLSPISLRERQVSSWNNRRGRPEFYELWNGLGGPTWRIRLSPVPDAAYSVRVFFTPSMELGDFGQWVPNPDWSEAVVIAASIKVKDKEESDVSVLMAEKAAVWDAAKRAFSPVDASEAARVVQVGKISGGVGRFRGMSDDPVMEDDLYA